MAVLNIRGYTCMKQGVYNDTGACEN